MTRALIPLSGCLGHSEIVRRSWRIAGGRCRMAGRTLQKKAQVGTTPVRGSVRALQIEMQSALAARRKLLCVGTCAMQGDARRPRLLSCASEYFAEFFPLGRRLAPPPPPSPLPYFPLPSFVNSFGHFSDFYFFVGSSLVSLFFSVRFPSASRSRARSIYTPFAVPFPSAGSSPLSQRRRPLSLCLIKVQQML